MHDMKNELKIEEFSVCGKTVHVVEEHHHVIVPWARFRRSTAHPFTVITLDHHTDILPAGGYNHAVCRLDYANDEALFSDLAALRHDEHLDWAVKSGIAARAVVFAHEDFTIPASPELQVVRDPSWPDTQEILKGSAAARDTASKVLESDFLSRQLSAARILPETPIILDIDLDYFLCGKAVRPDDSGVFLSLVRRSPLITVSLERDWVRLLRFRGEEITSESILSDLLKLMKEAE